MTQLAVKPSAVYGAALNKTRVQIQKPEISTYHPSVNVETEAAVGLSWKLMVALTYLFSLVTFYFVFSV